MARYSGQCGIGGQPVVAGAASDPSNADESRRAPVTRLAWPNLSAVEELMSGIPLEHRTYLRDGEILFWRGPVEDVLSPVCVEDRGGLRPLRLGSHPRLDGAEALKALDAAVAAYDRGRGAWPTMSVADRIAHVEAFVAACAGGATRSCACSCGRSARRCRTRQASSTARSSTSEDTIDGPQGTRSHLLSLRHRAGHHRPDPARAARRRAVHGAVQLPAERDLHHADPGPDHGQHRRLQAAQARRAAATTAARGLPRRVPAGRRQHRLRRGQRRSSGRSWSRARSTCSPSSARPRSPTMLKQQHPRPHRLRCVLGLEAKNPAIVLPMPTSTWPCASASPARCRFNGQRCTAIKMLFVHAHDRRCLRRRASATPSRTCAAGCPGRTASP